MLKWTVIVSASVLFAAAALGEESFEPSESQIELAALNDTYRAARGLDPHRLDPECCRIAQRWAETMAARQSMFHGGGEQIIAWNGGSATHCMGMWRGSGPHNSWLLSRTTLAGWGHAVSGSGAHYWAGAFRNDPPPPKPDQSEQATATANQWRPRRGVLWRLFRR